MFQKYFFIFSCIRPKPRRSPRVFITTTKKPVFNIANVYTIRILLYYIYATREQPFNISSTYVERTERKLKSLIYTTEQITFYFIVFVSFMCDLQTRQLENLVGTDKCFHLLLFAISVFTQRLFIGLGRGSRTPETPHKYIRTSSVQI